MHDQTALPADQNWRIWLAALLVAVFTFLAYRNSFQVPFIFDDLPTILENPTILRVWPLDEAVFPPPNSGITTAGRPLANLSLAFNYAIGGFAVKGYHIFNWIAHLGAALVLMGVIRRTLLRAEEFRSGALLVSFIAAALWALHPLNTVAVTYIVQRAEVLTSLFYLLTLYCFIRGVESGNGKWLILSVASCLLSISSKEVGATIPLVIFLYDRTFVAGNFKAAWATRWHYYLALLSSGIFQGLLILSTGDRGGTTGLKGKMSSLDYALTQCWAIPNYLKQACWPSNLIFDYGADTVTRSSEVFLPAIVVLALLVLTLIALRKRPVAGFMGAAFFLILAPSSSFVPVLTQTIAEHRMYLPLAVLIAFVVGGLYSWSGKKSLVIFAVLAIGCGLLTYQRNDDYKTHLAIWRDTAEKRPQNARAWKSLGVLISQLGDYAVALKMYDHARQIEPRDPSLYFNSANALGKLGRVPEAIEEYKTSIQMKPGFAEARNNLANIYLQTGRAGEALAELKVALRINPQSAEVHYNMGRAAQLLGNLQEARAHLRECLRLRPHFPAAADALSSLDREAGPAAL